MPDIFGALLQDRRNRQQDSAAALKAIAVSIEQNRLRKLGQEFMQSWDGSPESAKSFAVAKGLSADEYAGILEMVKTQQSVGPQWTETQTQDASGNISKQLYDQNNPQNVRDLGISERAKLQRFDGVNSDGSKLSQNFNPTSGTATPTLDQSGQAVVTAPQPVVQAKSYVNGQEVTYPQNALTGEGIGVAHASGMTMADKIELEKAKAEIKLGGDLEKYPNVAEAMATGWMPTGRITGPMLEMFEAAMTKAKVNGEPLTKEKLFDMEFNARKNSATGATAGGRLTVARKQNINTAFQLIDDLEETNKNLGYSDTQMAGKFEQFVRGELNDPLFTEYMTQRADSLFVLGNALKQNGLTDKSIEVEEEAFRPTLSPRAFKAWVNVQKRALNKAAGEMNKDFKYDIQQQPTVPAGQGGDGEKRLEDTSGRKPLSAFHSGN